MINNESEFKYETRYNFPIDINDCWTDDMVTVQIGQIKIIYNIRRVKPYKSYKFKDYIEIQSR